MYVVNKNPCPLRSDLPRLALASGDKKVLKIFTCTFLLFKLK